MFYNSILLYLGRYRKREFLDIACRDRCKVRGSLGVTLEVAPCSIRRCPEVQPFGTYVPRSNGKHVVLMQARRNLAPPDAASAQFVVVPTLVHQHVTGTQREGLYLVLRQVNRLDVPEVEMPVLNVGDTQIRVFHRFEAARLLAQRKSSTNISHEFQPGRRPMRRDVAEQRDAGIVNGDVWMETASDGAGDKGTALLREQSEDSSLFGCQPVEAGCLAVEVVDNRTLLRRRWNRQYDSADARLGESKSCDAIRCQFQLNPYRLRLQAAKQELPGKLVSTRTEKRQVVAAQEIVGCFRHE